MRVSELEGAELDYWALRAIGHGPMTASMFVNVGASPSTAAHIPVEWVERFDVAFYRATFSNKETEWVAKAGWEPEKRWQDTGDTPQQAICRAIVASVYGGEVDWAEAGRRTGDPLGNEGGRQA